MNGRRAAALAVCLGLAGCAPNLFVVDEAGKPLEGAEIYRMFPSFGGL